MTSNAAVRSTSGAAVCLAIDAVSIQAASGWVEPLASRVGVLKVGLELFSAEGPAAVRWASGLGCDVFVDLKLHDIPETVERAVASVAALGARFLTVHGSGGPRMIERAVERAGRECGGMTILVVTALTSLDDDELRAAGFEGGAATYARRLASMAHAAGAQGFVSSAHEVASLRAAFGPSTTLVTPGVRPEGAAAGDQRRVATPRRAIAEGADLIVVGRPVRDAVDPSAALNAVIDEVGQGLSDRRRH